MRRLSQPLNAWPPILVIVLGIDISVKSLQSLNVSLAIVPNAGHVCNIDNKSYFNQLSIDFIERVNRGIAC